MKPRPLYRWKTFWLGLIILAFLCWAWASSMERYLVIRAHSPIGWIGIGQNQGQAGLFAHKSKGGWSIDVTDFKLDGRVQRLPEMWKFHTSSWGIIVASHFWFVLFFTIPWAALLTWRWRGTQRLPAGSAEPPARRNT